MIDKDKMYTLKEIVKLGVLKHYGGRPYTYWNVRTLFSKGILPDENPFSYYRRPMATRGKNILKLINVKEKNEDVS